MAPVVPPVAATQLDSSQATQASQASNSESQGGHGQQEQRDRVRSPRRGQGQAAASVRAPVLSPKEQFLENHPGWKVNDPKGQGDCGFRSIAQAMTFSQQTTLDEQQLEREACKLRVLSVGHLVKNKHTDQNEWQPDATATVEQCAGQDIPQDFSDYCMVISKKKFWMDGMMIHALMERLGTVIVVFVWNGEDKTWSRTVFARKFQDDVAQISKNGTAPVALLLQNQHFFLLQPEDKDAAMPLAWMKKTPVRAREFYKGAGKHSTSSLVVPPHTPTQVSCTSTVRKRSKASRIRSCRGGYVRISDGPDSPDSRQPLFSTKTP